MSDARLTKEQWSGIGRFQQLLAERLDVAWSLGIYHGEMAQPAVEVELRMPVERHFQSLDDVVKEAFDEAKIPGYENSGWGHNPNPINGAIMRDLDFHPVAEGSRQRRRKNVEPNSRKDDKP